MHYRLNQRIRLVAEASGGYGESSARIFSISSIGSGPFVDLPRIDVRKLYLLNHSLVFGPEFRLWGYRRIAVNLLAGAGIARGRPDTPLAAYFSSAGDRPELPPEIGFAARGGVSADIRLSNRLAYRLVQSDYQATRFGSAWQRNLRFATGIVITIAR